MRVAGGVEVRPAAWPRDTSAARSLLDAYFRWLAENTAVPPSIRGLDRTAELQGLEAACDGVSRHLLIAWQNGEAVGCAALQRLLHLPASMELKRLYVTPASRGCGAGRALLQACIEQARRSGAEHLLLDTLPAAMPGAMALYRSYGFEPIDRYNSSDGPGFAFFGLHVG